MRRIPLVVAPVVFGLLLASCGGGGTVSPTESPPTESPPATESPTPSPSGPDQPVIWPAPSVVFGTPEAAAADFVAHALGVPPSLGDFQQGDTRSGEVPVFFAGGDGTPVQRGLLLLRQFGPDSGWFITAAPNDVVTISAPGQGASVAAGILTVEGVARGFEGHVGVTAFVSGDAEAVLDRQVTIAGSLETPEPYSVTLDLSEAAPGDTIVILVHGGVGHEDDPGEFAAIAVVIAD